MARYRDCVFTSFDDQEPVWNDKFLYLAYQQEKCPETGKLHWQGFCQATNPKASHQAWLKALGIKKGHAEPRRGTPQAASDYCTSAVYNGKHKGQIDGTTRIYGTLELRNSPGKREDLSRAHDAILGKRRWAEVILDPELAPVVSRHLNWAKEVFANKPLTKMPFPHEKFYPWQQELFDILSVPCTDDRTIHWVCGAYNQGKTEFCKFLMRNYDACILPNKAADVFHMYDDEPIAIFDIPKDVVNTDKDYISYAAIEKIKDGSYASGKYQGKKACRDYPAHVVVFANCLPKDNCWDPSRTRLVVL